MGAATSRSGACVHWSSAASRSRCRQFEEPLDRARCHAGRQASVAVAVARLGLVGPELACDGAPWVFGLSQPGLPLPGQSRYKSSGRSTPVVQLIPEGAFRLLSVHGVLGGKPPRGPSCCGSDLVSPPAGRMISRARCSAEIDVPILHRPGRAMTDETGFGGRGLSHGRPPERSPNRGLETCHRKLETG
jgi:hypothetical protein